MKKLVTNVLVALTIIPLINSCGKKSSGSNAALNAEPDGGRTEEQAALPDLIVDGQYLAKFVTLNTAVNGTIPGSLTLNKTGDKLLTYVRLFAGKPSAWHQQGIYMGQRCPDLGDDKNNDGFIDIEEALTVVGDMIIPLDASMDSQAAGKNIYPLADISGYYHYEREASFNALAEDLKKEDKDPNDHVAKLAPGESFPLEGRVFMVQGIDEPTMLPDSVMSNNRRRAFQTLPITCGIIQKLTTAPGVPDSGEIPGPVAAVDSTQDRPAPAEDTTTGTTAGGTIAGTTTGTNETNEGEVGDAGGSEDGSTGGETTGETVGGSVTGGTGEATTGGTAGGTVGGTAGETVGGTAGGTAGGTTGDTTGDTTGGGTTGGSTTGESTSGGTTGGSTGRSSGGFIGGFIGGSSGGGSTGGRNSGGFIGGFIGGSDDGDDNSSRRSIRSSRRTGRIFPD